MIIQDIKFFNFRNHALLNIQKPGSLVIIVGDNAVGKTNIIEGLQLLSMQESFRNPVWSELVRHKECELKNVEKKDKNNCKITIIYSNNERKLDLSLVVEEGRRSFFLNNKYRSASDLVGLLPAVLFTPDDLHLIKGPAGARRDLLDSLGGRLSKTFASIKSDYIKVIKQKNLLLKNEQVNLEVLDSWNHNLIKLGASLFVHRLRLFNKMMVAAAASYEKISCGEQLTAQYLSSFNATLELSQEVVESQLNKALATRQSEELNAKRALVGPHRDDICLYIDGNDARRFGSQGQQRSAALALKIAEIDILRTVTGNDPLLLLDDVMSELDEQRREQLLGVINHSTQTFITTTNLSYFDEKTVARAKLIRLPQINDEVESARG